MAANATSVRPRILCVDDEPHVLEALEDVLRRSFDVRVASSGADAPRVAPLAVRRRVPACSSSTEAAAA